MKGRSGRNRREISWTPTAFAGVHLRSYRLWWQLGVPFWVGPDKQLVEPSRPGVPVPATVERRENHCQPDPTGIRDKPTPRAMTGTRHCKVLQFSEVAQRAICFDETRSGWPAAPSSRATAAAGTTLGLRCRYLYATAQARTHSASGRPVKSPDKKSGLNMPGGNMRYPQRTGAFLPPAAWRYV